MIRTGRSELIADIADEALEAAARDPEQLELMRDLGISAYVIAPMVARGQILGAITFVTTESGRRFGDLDVAIAEDLAHRAAMAVDNARLHAEALAARRRSEEALAEAKEAREAAELASRAKSEFLAVMSHELRTPLNAIAGYAELLELEVHGPITAEQHDDLARIQRSQRHLMGLINGVLNYSRLSAGAVEFDLRDVQLAEALVRCESLIAPQFASKRLTLVFQSCDPAIRVRADPEKLQQILLNLLGNAVKFTEAGGRVTVACTPETDVVAISVSDTGRGIARDQLERIFEPFVQADSRFTRTEQGVGLGLAISRDLARGMGGDLRVESSRGEGSTFTVTLPRL